MNDFGFYLLAFALLTSVCSFAFSIYAGKNKLGNFLSAGRTALILSCVFNIGSYLTLSFLFLKSDFANLYVWQTSSVSMPWYYRLAAVWGGMDGSLLLWSFLLSISTLIMLIRSKVFDQLALPWIIAISSAGLCFFQSVLIFASNPFRYIDLDTIPVDGNGLNPLLQNPYMAIHPPMLYLGFTNFAIPFAICVGYLIANNTTNQWVTLTRKWTLIAWGFLTIGIFLGAHWAYLELGWGGFWAWDPVENASFLPWLTGTAYLHSVIVQERKDLLKIWNVFLITLTYGLTIFGTFLTRSGIVQSVHSFAESDIGHMFLIYLIIILIFSGVVIFYRRNSLKSVSVLNTIFSKEAFFLLNNLIFLTICFATLWGVLFPVISEAITGNKQVVGIPFFNAINVPLFLVLLFLMAVTPLLNWRENTLGRLAKVFTSNFISCFIISIILFFAGIKDFYSLLSFSLAWFIVICLIKEVVTYSKNQGVKKHIIKNYSKYAGFIVHLGVVIASISITASMAYKFEQEFSLQINKSIQVQDYEVKLIELKEAKGSNYESLIATINIPNKNLTLHPEIRHYGNKKENTSEVALHMGLLNDLYLVLTGIDETGTEAHFKVFINPLQIWLWIGAGIMAIGTAFSILVRR